MPAQQNPPPEPWDYFLLTFAQPARTPCLPSLLARIPLKSSAQNTSKYGRMWIKLLYLCSSSAEGGTQGSEKVLPSHFVWFWVLGAKQCEFLCLECLLFYFVAQQRRREQVWKAGKNSGTPSRQEKILSGMGRKRKNKLFCATSAYSGGDELHYQQQFCFLLHAPHFFHNKGKLHFVMLY